MVRTNPTWGPFTLAHLALAQLHRLGYHEIVGGVSRTTLQILSYIIKNTLNALMPSECNICCLIFQLTLTSQIVALALSNLTSPTIGGKEIGVSSSGHTRYVLRLVHSQSSAVVSHQQLEVCEPVKALLDATAPLLYTVKEQLKWCLTRGNTHKLY